MKDSRNESHKPLVDAYGNPYQVTETPHQRRSKHPRLLRLYKKLGKLFQTTTVQQLGGLGRYIFGLVLAFATSIALWQLLVAEPEIHPIDFGAKGPYPAHFTVHNPFFMDMYRVQVADALAGGMISTGPAPPDLRAPMIKFPGLTLPQLVLAQTPVFDIAGAAPTVPNVKLLISDHNTFNEGAALVLDGVECNNCALTDGATIRYSGGLYKLENLVRSGKLNITLAGPALNTAALLTTFGLIGCPAAAPVAPPNPSNPMLKTASFKKETVGLMRSASDQK